MLLWIDNTTTQLTEDWAQEAGQHLGKGSGVTWMLPEPMLSTPVPAPELRPGWAGEPKWDGFRAAVMVDEARVVLRSRRGTDMGPAFPEIVAGAVQLPDASALDGELVVWDAAGRLAFEQLQDRLAPGAVPELPGRRRSGRPASWRSICSGCPERTRPGGRTSGVGPRWNPCSPPTGCRRLGCCARRPPTRRPCASG
jgi:hypothetical protein